MNRRAGIGVSLLAGLASLYAIACGDGAVPTPQPMQETRPPAAAAVRGINPPNNENSAISPLIDETPAPSPTSTPIPIVREYTPAPKEPTAIPAPPPTNTSTPTTTSALEPTTIHPQPAPTPTRTPVSRPIATPEMKPFELVCGECTPEQHRTFSDIALADYRTVLDVYGIGEKEARISILVNLRDFGGTGGYSVRFNYKNAQGGAAGPATNFTTDRSGMSHEMAHAVNHSLFADIPLWLDEGIAQVVERVGADFSGELYKKFENDPKLWENQKSSYGPGSGNTPTHLIGRVFYSGLYGVYGLTEDRNRTAINLMHQNYRNTRRLAMSDIKDAYQTVLGRNLDRLFSIVTDGIETLYPVAGIPLK